MSVESSAFRDGLSIVLIESVIVGAHQEISVGVDECHRIFRADVFHVDRHARARKIGDGE
jgi:hypothetical protein